METILSGESGLLFFFIGTVIVTAIVWRGYTKNIFSPWFAWLSMLVFVSYMIAFLWYRYTLGDVAEHMDTERWYPLIGAIHGIISLGAIVHACFAFIRAERAFAKGENYFVTHKRITVLLLVLWPLALLSGMFL